jgi:hypothetical protein
VRSDSGSILSDTGAEEVKAQSALFFAGSVFLRSGTEAAGGDKALGEEGFCAMMEPSSCWIDRTSNPESVNAEGSVLTEVVRSNR